MLGGLRFEIGDVDVAFGSGCDDHDAHARHDGAGGIGSVRRGRDQHHVAMAIAAVVMIGANHHQAGELALRSGVGLQGNSGESGDLAQRLFEVA